MRANIISMASLKVLMCANINLFHFSIKNKYLSLRKCLFRNFLQKKRILNVHRSEYLSTLSDENFGRCKS